MSNALNITCAILANVLICVGILAIWFNPFIALALIVVAIALYAVACIVPVRHTSTWRCLDD